MRVLFISMANIDSFSNPSTGIFHRIQSINLLIRRSALLFPFFSENKNSCEWKNAIKFVPCGVHFSICAPYTSWFVLGTLLDLCSWKLAHKHNQLINQIPNHVGDGWNEKKKTTLSYSGPLKIHTLRWHAWPQVDAWICNVQDLPMANLD